MASGRRSIVTGPLSSTTVAGKSTSATFVVVDDGSAVMAVAVVVVVVLLPLSAGLQAATASSKARSSELHLI
jgi:hypothetical protein